MDAPTQEDMNTPTKNIKVNEVINPRPAQVNKKTHIQQPKSAPKEEFVRI